MAQQPKAKEKKTVYQTLLEQNHVEFGSPEHLAQLELAYGMSLTDAKGIVADWEKDHQSYPLEEVKKARALIAAATTKPKPVSTDEGWKRTIRE